MRIFYYLINPRQLAGKILQYCHFLSDEKYVKLQYYLIMGKKINLTSPITLSEKLNWLKLYYHNPKLHLYVDKYEVGRYVERAIGKDYVIPCIGLWDDVEDIDFESLPNQFVLKCTHDSGSVIICRDKSTLDIDLCKRNLKRGQLCDYYLGKREWAYKGVKARIIAEPLISSLGNPDSVEYKITVYNGKVKFITVCTGIAHDSLEVRTNDHFTPEWERLPFYAYYKPSGRDIMKPPFMDKMVQLTEKLAEDLPQVRVDWFVHEGKIYFGEVTFYTWAGYLKFIPEEWDERLGAWLELPTQKWI